MAELASITALVESVASTTPWDAWRPASCYPGSCFCEAVRSGWVRQPANAVSSLAFVGVALLVVRRSGAAAAPYVLALLVIGVGSAFFHASLSFMGQFVDVLGMYLIGTFIILDSIRRSRRLPARFILTAYILVNTALAVVLFTIPAVRRYVFALLILTGLVLEVRSRTGARADARTLGVAVLLLAAGFAIWILDITRAACLPGSWLQGHALWHLLGAAAAWKLYQYYSTSGATDAPAPHIHSAAV